MSYIKQNWIDGAEGGTPISAERLNHIEDGIEDAHKRIDELPEGVSEWQPDTPYVEGVLVIHDGNLYIALVDTEDEPPSEDWGLYVTFSQMEMYVEEHGGDTAPIQKDLIGLFQPITNNTTRRGVRFLTTKDTAITASYSSEEGATGRTLSVVRWDGDTQDVNNHNGTITTGNWGAAPAAPYNSHLPKFGAFWIHTGNDSHTVDSLRITSSGVTAIDISNLPDLKELNLSDFFTQNHISLIILPPEFTTLFGLDIQFMGWSSAQVDDFLIDLAPRINMSQGGNIMTIVMGGTNDPWTEASAAARGIITSKGWIIM